MSVNKQLGEVTGANNQAQENVFEFEPAASSVPEPVSLAVAVRNPLKVRALIHISLEGVPRWYHVYFPHRWLWLDGLAERKLTLLVVALEDLNDIRPATIRLSGHVARVYTETLDITGVPGSWLAPIGGIVAKVTPKHHGRIRLRPSVRIQLRQAIVTGAVEPRLADQQVRVDMTRPNGQIIAHATRTDANGRFEVGFALTPHNPQQEATFTFQAHVMGATQIASCASNVVLLQA